MEVLTKKDFFYFLGQGRLLICNEIHAEQLELIHEALLARESNGHQEEDLTVEIHTNGGRADIGLTIYGLLKMHKAKKITGVVNTHARSMGAIILQACDTRIMAPDAKLLIHAIHRKNVDALELINEKQLKQFLDEVTSSQVRCEDILLERATCTRKELREIMRRDRDITAIEARDLGLIDDIRSY